uniref:NADH-ubiquinone oxidoreductase chain 1 n=1 Tax=Trichodectes canis TaxID=209909 RepID=A0A386B2F0_9NEOP|nr:NADH dehydrogenase subunit 1 [Trichodectes canis]
MILLLSILEIHVFILMAVAFYTVMERKILGLIQLRHGPMKVGFIGILQPFSDALKLITKALSVPVNTSHSFGFMLSPFMAFVISLMGWLLYPGLLSFSTDILWMFCFLSVTAYPVLFSGWFSNSKYARIGSTRSVALGISYEIPLTFSIFGMLLVVNNPSLNNYIENFSWFLPICCFGLLLLVVIGFMVETARTPFDLSEAESELVSGYNVEYGGGLYTLLFLSEYVAMFFSGFVISCLFMEFNPLGIIIYVFLIAVVRASLPRIRFDKLMFIGWVVLIPLSLFFISINAFMR